jgi:hypothetical protein
MVWNEDVKSEGSQPRFTSGGPTMAAAGAEVQKIPLLRKFKRAFGSLVAYCFSWYRY